MKSAWEMDLRTQELQAEIKRLREGYLADENGNEYVAVCILKEKISELKEKLALAVEGLEGLLESHFNLYKSVFGESSNPEDDLVRIKARDTLEKIK